MSLFSYLELQPIDPQDDGTVSELDQYNEEEPFDMSSDPDGNELANSWEHILHDLHE